MKGDKMRECSCCEKEGIHRWGKYWLCDECHKRMLKTHQSKDKVPTINIPEKTAFPFAGGWYTQGKSAIYLVKSPYNLEGVINHEVMHHVLNTFVDPPTSYDYDNIDSYIDPYHDLS